MKTRKTDPKFVRSYVRGMLRSAFVSLFWAVITERRKKGFTFLALAKLLGTNKGEVSRWFNGDPNWTINTIASIADALNVEVRIQAVDRDTGVIFTPIGVLQSSVSSTKSVITTTAVETNTARESSVPMDVTRIPPSSKPPKVSASFSAMAA